MSHTRTNILLLVGEDTGIHQGCYGDPFARTPVIDRLAAEGARYTNAFSHAPVCAPSRGSLVTGCYPWSLGIHQMRSLLLDPPRLFTHELVDAGYQVFWPTKLDFNLEPTDGWCSSTDEWWKSGLPHDRPFFAYRNMAITHESQMWTPSEEKATGGEIAVTPWADPDQVPVPPYLPDLPEVRLQIARYYDNLKAQDDGWGQCLMALEESGRADNTMVIYLTDHGRGLPREKRWCYDAGIHLPLIIRRPGQIAPGTICNELVSWVDIAPTLLTAAGISCPDHFQGCDFLSETGGPHREYHFAGRDRMDESYDCQRVCRSTRWHYVRNDFPEIPFARRNHYQEQAPAVVAMRDAWAAGNLSGDEAVWFSPIKAAEEFFDVIADPYCLHNVAGDPAHAEARALHRRMLEEHLEQVGDWGAVREQIAVDRGLVEEQIARFSALLGPLPEQHAVEPAQASVEMPRPRWDAWRFMK